jgi:hypothetical protein
MYLLRNNEQKVTLNGLVCQQSVQAHLPNVELHLAKVVIWGCTIYVVSVKIYAGLYSNVSDVKEREGENCQSLRLFRWE